MSDPTFVMVRLSGGGLLEPPHDVRRSRRKGEMARTGARALCPAAVRTARRTNSRSPDRLAMIALPVERLLSLRCEKRPGRGRLQWPRAGSRLFSRKPHACGACTLKPSRTHLRWLPFPAGGKRRNEQSRNGAPPSPRQPLPPVNNALFRVRSRNTKGAVYSCPRGSVNAHEGPPRKVDRQARASGPAALLGLGPCCPKIDRISPSAYT